MSESISEKIAGILNSAPVSFDPEDDVHEETRARVELEIQNESDQDKDEDDLLPSKFRKQNAELLEEVDRRYEGKRSSRKKLLDSNGWASDDDDDDSSADINESQSDNEDVEVSDEEVEAIDEEVEDTDEEIEEETDAESASGSDDADEDDNADFNIEEDQNFKHLEDSDTSHQINKGLCVRNQLSIWENLLEMRIQMQKCLLTANKLPQTPTINDIKDKCGKQFTDKVSESKKGVSNLLHKLLELQLLLLKKYPETKKLLLAANAEAKEKLEESDEEIPSDTDEEPAEDVEDTDEEVPSKKLKIADYKSEIERRHKLYKNYRNSVIQKWNDKTRIALSKSGGSTHSVTNQIEHILGDKEKLIKRTQLKRADYEILGEQNLNETNGKSQDGSNEVYNTNIFDDTDFYHHLLRELIEFKSADVTDPVQLGRQWMQLQTLRSKMKRKIDTKATKGRKIRYVVHTKLVNFMAPIEDNDNSGSAAKDLYGSLFGKNQIF